MPIGINSDDFEAGWELMEEGEFICEPGAHRENCLESVKRFPNGPQAVCPYHARELYNKKPEHEDSIIIYGYHGWHRYYVVKGDIVYSHRQGASKAKDAADIGFTIFV